MGPTADVSVSKGNLTLTLRKRTCLDEKVSLPKVPSLVSSMHVSTVVRCLQRGLLDMAQEPPTRDERRLAAILAADVAGYSPPLMHQNEETTHAILGGA